MATIVQPYNPWREQLAFNALGNIAGNILGDIWARHKQSEENKKINAFRGQLQQDLQSNAGNNISLAQPTAPDGYNSNPWGNALHQKYSPLTQFDIGTGGIGKVPSIQDIAQGVDRLAAIPRFSMLGQEAVGKVRNDFMQRAYADMFANGNNLGDKMDIITQSVMNGLTPVQALAPYGQYATKRLQPYVFSPINTGDKVGVLASNAETGQSAPAFMTAMGIDPNTVATLANQRDIANIGADTQRYGYDVASRDRNRGYDIEESQQLWERDNPNLEQHVDADGHVWRINPRTGEPTLVTDANGNPITARSDDTSAKLRYLSEQYKDLTNQLNRAKLIAEFADTVEEREAAKQTVKELEQYIEDNRAEYNRIANKPAQPAPPPTQTQQTTQPEQPATFNALGTGSADVPAIPASADRTPADPISTAMRTVGADVQYQPTQQTTQPVQPVQQSQTAQPPARQTRASKGQARIMVSNDGWYNPERDRNISEDLIVTPEEFATYVDARLAKRPQETPQQAAEYWFKHGVKIRRQ